MSKSTNDLVVEWVRRLAERLRRWEAYQQVADEIPQDQYFPRMIRWVVEEIVWLQIQQHLDEASSLSNLRDAKSILQTLAIGVGDSEAYWTFDSKSDNENIIHSNYRSNHDTLDELEEDWYEHTLTL